MEEVKKITKEEYTRMIVTCTFNSLYDSADEIPGSDAKFIELFKRTVIISEIAIQEAAANASAFYEIVPKGQEVDPDA